MDDEHRIEGNERSKILFGPFEYDKATGELLKYGTRIRLNGQPLQILVLLLNHPGIVITREDLAIKLWGRDTFVDFEHGLNAAINRLRRALGDSADQPHYVETVQGSGYRFIAPIEFSATPDEQAVAGQPPIPVEATTADSIRMVPKSRQSHFFKILWTLGLVLPPLVVIGIWVQHWVTRQTELYRLEAQGRFLVIKWTEADVKQGIEFYTRALALNPASASAYAGMSTGWAFLSDLHSPPHEVMPRSKAAALRSVQLNDSLPNAHRALAMVKMQYDWDWAGAEREFRRAIQLDPVAGIGHRLYGWLLIALGRFDEAQSEMRRGLDDDQLDDFNLMELGLSHYFARQYESAVAECRQAIGIKPTEYWSHMLLGWAHEQQGDFSAAIEELIRANRLSNASPQVIASLGHAYASSGRRKEALKTIAELQNISSQSYVSPYDLATIYIGIGDKERALAWLERAYQDRSGWLALWIKVDPKFDAIRSEPRFARLLERIGLTQRPY